MPWKEMNLIDKLTSIGIGLVGASFGVMLFTCMVCLTVELLRATF